jgi:hypothetical protein
MGNHGDQFDYYIVTAKDPGLFLLVLTILISVALYALLPCMVACAMRRDKQFKEQEELLKAENKEEKDDQAQRNQKAYSREIASISGICDAQQGRSFVKTIPNAWKHSSKLLKKDSGSSRDNGMIMLNPMPFIQACIQNVARATHKANDIKRTGMQKRLFHFVRTDDNEDGDGVMIDASAKQEISGIFSYNAMTELSVPVVLQPTRADVGGDGGRAGNYHDKNDDDDDDDYLIPTQLRIKGMSPIHPLTRTYYTCRNVCKWDTENRRILKLALPYVCQALVTGVAEAARVGILAGLYDTRSMSAYVICVMLIGFTAEFFGGILDSQGTKEYASVHTNGALIHISTNYAINLSLLCFVIASLQVS